MNATIYRDMPEAEYRAIRAVNASSLKAGAVSMAHMKLAMAGDSTTSAAKELGSLAHLAILEPARFDQVRVAPDFGDQRTKAGKEAKAAWLSGLEPGARIADIDDHNAAKAMAAACYAHEDLALALRHPDGQNEVVITWTDRTTGLACKARIDRLILGRMIIDVKTARSATAFGFSRAIAAYGYHLQAAWYSRAVEELTREETPPFGFAVVESSAPFGAACYVLDPADIDAADQQNSRILAQWAKAVETGTYSSIQPDGRMSTIRLPSWLNGESNVDLAGEA